MSRPYITKDVIREAAAVSGESPYLGGLRPYTAKAYLLWRPQLGRTYGKLLPWEARPSKIFNTKNQVPKLRMIFKQLTVLVQVLV